MELCYVQDIVCQMQQPISLTQDRLEPPFLLENNPLHLLDLHLLSNIPSLQMQLRYKDDDVERSAEFVHHLSQHP